VRRKVLVACALLLARPAFAQWMFRGDPAHTASGSSSAPRQLKGVKWRFPTGDRIVSSPVYRDGVIYIGSDDGNVYAVDAASGRQRWARPTRGPVSSTPAATADTVYALSYDGRLYALDAGTGAVRWSFATGGERRFEARHLHGFLPANQTFLDPFDVFLSSPTVVDGVVYFGSGDGKVYAVDAASGELRWSFATGDVVHASPAVAGGVVYVGSWDGDFYAIDAATGKERWRFHGGRDDFIHNQVGFQSSPTVVDGVVYTGCRDSNLYALEASSGRERWRVNNEGSWVISSPVVAGDRVWFATSDSRRVRAVEVATGKPVVEEKGLAYMFSSPTPAGDVLLLGEMGGRLTARDLKTGAHLWQYTVEAARRNLGWLLAADGTLDLPFVYGSTWGAAPFAAFERQLGIGAVCSTPIAVDGTVYFASTDGALYALE
jgi:eukaryotic-like serine/threonine-protein kinase